MSIVTKAYTSSLRGISVSADGKILSCGIEWSSAEKASTSPTSVPDFSRQRSTFTPITVTDGKVLVGGVKVADAPADISRIAADLAAKIVPFVDDLIVSGKVKP